MDAKQTRGNEDSVQHQQPQQYTTSSDLYQTNRVSVAASINQVGRRQSITHTNEVPIGIISQQRLENRNQQQQIPIQATQQQIVHSGIQQQQLQQQSILQQTQQQPLLQQRPSIPQTAQTFQAQRPVILNRGPAPQQQYIVRAPIQQLQQQQQQPRQQLQQQQSIQHIQPQQSQIINRASIPQSINSSQILNQIQNQGVSLKQIVNANPNQNQPSYSINRGAVPISNQQQYSQQIISQPNPQYRPQVQAQPRPLFNQNIQKLPTHLEERRMATEVNQTSIAKSQPSYIISNSDDVDDVIVRPISQLKMEQPIIKPDNDLMQHQQAPQIAKPSFESKIPSSVLQSSNIDLNISRPLMPPPKQPESVVKSTTPTKPVEAPRQNGSNSKPIEKSNGDSNAARTTSRASSHVSQEDVNQRSSSRSRAKLLEKPVEPPKKVSMNKIKVGNAPPPNLREVRSKIGSLSNASHKPGGGKVKIENKKIEFNVSSRIAAKNESYMPRGGDKKITSTKLNWNAKSKIGSLENANHKPGGGDKKILNLKTEYGNAKPKVGSVNDADKQSP